MALLVGAVVIEAIFADALAGIGIGGSFFSGIAICALIIVRPIAGGASIMAALAFQDLIDIVKTRGVAGALAVNTVYPGGRTRGAVGALLFGAGQASVMAFSK